MMKLTKQGTNVRLFYMFFCMILLTGCNQESEKTDDDLVVINEVQLKLQEEKIIGYWQPENPDSFAYSFYPSGLDMNTTDGLKTGSLYQQGKLLTRFHWTALESGVIRINVVNSSCDRRPLTQCQTKEVLTVRASGDSYENALWRVSSDSDLDGVYEREASDNYKKNHLELSGVNEGPLYLTPENEYFSPVRFGQLKGTTLSIEFTEFGSPINMYADRADAEAFSLQFINRDNNRSESTRSYFVEGEGYRDFVLVTKLENVILTQAINSSYALSYDIYREVEIPDDVTPELVNITDVTNIESRTRVYTLVDDFIAGPVIQAQDKFYSRFINQFNEQYVDEGGTNEILFSTATQGELIYTDEYEDRYSQKRLFDWQQLNDGTVKLSFEDNSEMEIRFIRETFGGYKALIKTITSENNTDYLAHDFLMATSPLDMSNDIPGRFAISSDTGFSTIFVDFNEDNTLTFPNIPQFSGYWFIDTNGEIVSFECTDLFERAIDSFQECYNEFQDLSPANRSVNFSHIRRMSFLHKNENNYQVKYDGIFWGELLNVTNDNFPDYYAVSWTYRFMRLGDVSSD